MVSMDGANTFEFRDPVLRRPVDNLEVLHPPNSNFRTSKQMETKTMQRNLSQQANTEAQQIEQNHKLSFYILYV